MTAFITTSPTQQPTVSIIGDSNEISVIGSTVGSGVFLLLAIVVSILAVFFFIKIRQRRREWKVVESKELGNSFNNAIYLSGELTFCSIISIYFFCVHIY